MAAKHMSNDEFFQKLAQLIEHTQKKGHGTVLLTQKRLASPTGNPASTIASGDGTFADLHLDAPVPILIRATDAVSQSIDRKKNTSKVKLSTVVEPDQLEAFFTRYAEVCRAGMQSLRKRDRSKRKKKGKKETKKEIEGS